MNWKPRKFRNYAQGGHSGSHAIAWAAISTFVRKVFLGPPIQSVVLQFHASCLIKGLQRNWGDGGKAVMNCFFHPDRPSVIACAKCGVGLCRECMSEAAYTYEGRPLCLNCSREIAIEELADCRKTRTWSLVKCIFSGFFLGLGLVAMIGGADIMQVWIVAGIAGLPTAFKTFRRTREQRIADEIHDRFERDIVNLLFVWMIRFLIKMAFIIALAPICALYTFISNLITFLKSGKRIEEAQTSLNFIEANLRGDFDVPQPVAVVQSTSDSSSSFSPSGISSPSNPSSSNNSLNHRAQGKGKTTLWITSVIVLIAALTGYFLWYAPYAKDKNALRSYVFVNSLLLRSSQTVETEQNVVASLPYGTELITYEKMGDWAEVKYVEQKGFVSSKYILNVDAFRLLDGVWGNEHAKEIISTAKCRLAVLAYLNKNNLQTGPTGWQIYAQPENKKWNTVSFPTLFNGYDDFTEFAFILKNNATKQRRLALYSFQKDETPVLVFEDEDAPAEGEIERIAYYASSRIYAVSYLEENRVSLKDVYASSRQTPPPVPKLTPKEEEKEFRIIAVHFANQDYSENALSDFGASLYAGSVQYLRPRVTYYSSLSNQTKKLRLKLFNPAGILMTGGGSYGGFTYERDVYIMKGHNTVLLPGWGDANGKTYATPGRYRFEVWTDGTLLYTTYVDVNKSSL